MKHPYAEILIAIAEGKEIQIRDKSNKLCTGWVHCHENLFFANMNNHRTQYEYRIQPATITINGVECETPVDYPCCCVHILHPNHLAKTINFATKEARDAAYAALIKPFGEQA